jgi:hypothetical protein
MKKAVIVYQAPLKFIDIYHEDRQAAITKLPQTPIFLSGGNTPKDAPTGLAEADNGFCPKTSTDNGVMPGNSSKKSVKKRRVLFKFHAPEAEAVHLAGDFKEGCIVLIRSNGGNLGCLQAEASPGLRSISLAEIKWLEREEKAENGLIKIGARYY